MVERGKSRKGVTQKPKYRSRCKLAFSSDGRAVELIYYLENNPLVAGSIPARPTIAVR